MDSFQSGSRQSRKSGIDITDYENANNKDNNNFIKRPGHQEEQSDNDEAEEVYSPLIPNTVADSLDPCTDRLLRLPRPTPPPTATATDPSTPTCSSSNNNNNSSNNISNSGQQSSRYQYPPAALLPGVSKPFHRLFLGLLLFGVCAYAAFLYTLFLGNTRIVAIGDSLIFRSQTEYGMLAKVSQSVTRRLLVNSAS